MTVVVFAIEPRSYRQVIGQAVRAMRPRLEPDVVFANVPEDGEEPGPSAWVEFRPYEEPPARVRLAGERWTYPTCSRSWTVPRSSSERGGRD